MALGASVVHDFLKICRLVDHFHLYFFRLTLSLFLLLILHQVKRLSPGGDHHSLLGLDRDPDSLSHMLDFSSVRSGIRIRSGGRAAAFPIQNEFTVDKYGNIHAHWIDVKGVGTHADAAHQENVRNTGLLNLADALREFAMQRLIQHLCEREGEEGAGGWETVKFYGLVDTGLQYAEGHTNPATGWERERCVLAIRQRQSRAFINYFGYNFSGNLLMSGEEWPSSCMLRGPPRAVRSLLSKYGISCEVSPTSPFYVNEEVGKEAELDDISGMWNLQADAALTHLMDFSDYYVFPWSPLASWRMSERAFRDAVTLEKATYLEKVFQCPSLRRRLYGEEEEKVAREMQKAHVRELSQSKKILDACSQKVDTERGPQVLQGPPKYCMCWFMELDDSVMSRWALSGGDEEEGMELLLRIEKMLLK